MSLWSCKSIFILISVYKSLICNVSNFPYYKKSTVSIWLNEWHLWCLLTNSSVAKSSCMLLNEDVAHGFDVFVSFIWCVLRYVSTRVVIIRITCCTKPVSGVTAVASVFVVPNETNSCSERTRLSANSIETFFVAVALQGGLGTNKRFPHVTSQRGVAIFPISNQWVQRFCVHVDDCELGLLAHLHTQTDLGERCDPVGWQLGR